MLLRRLRRTGIVILDHAEGVLHGCSAVGGKIVGIPALRTTKISAPSLRHRMSLHAVTSQTPNDISAASNTPFSRITVDSSPMFALIKIPNMELRNTIRTNVDTENDIPRSLQTTQIMWVVYHFLLT